MVWGNELPSKLDKSKFFIMNLEFNLGTSLDYTQLKRVDGSCFIHILIPIFSQSTPVSFPYPLLY